MNEREKTIRLWFDMWLNQQDMGIDDIFTEDVIYTESWSPQYNNRKTVKHWFHLLRDKVPNALRLHFYIRLMQMSMGA